MIVVEVVPHNHCNVCLCGGGSGSGDYVVGGSQGGIKCANRRTGFIDSEGSQSKDPKHTLFCCETAFVAIYALFQG